MSLDVAEKNAFFSATSKLINHFLLPYEERNKEEDRIFPELAVY